MINRGRIISRRNAHREEISPMESMVNLVDVMLVFICGLLISIVMYWNLNMDNLMVILDNEQLIQIDNPEELPEQLQGLSPDENGLGTAIMDPKTGDVYVVGEKDDVSGTEEETGK